MARTRSRVIDGAAYLTLRILGCVVQVVSPELAVRVVRAFSSLAYRLDRRHREVAVDNLRQAFPGRYSEDQLRQLVRDVYQHFGTVLLEMALAPRKLGRRSWRRFLNLAENQAFRAVVESGRPVIFATAHFGNWELGAACMGLFGVRAHLVARPLDNPYLDAAFRRFRERTGHKVLAKNGDLARMRAVLADGGVLCTVVDQDAGPRGLFVDFFGRPASTHKAIAHLAQHSGALIAVVGAQNTGSLLHYTLQVTDVIRPEDYADHADAALAITRRVSAAIERLVRHDPCQYLWLHRRWKHEPVVKPAMKRAKQAAREVTPRRGGRPVPVFG